MSAGHRVPYSSAARVQRGGSEVWLRGTELCFANGASSPLKAFKATKKGTIPDARSTGEPVTAKVLSPQMGGPTDLNKCEDLSRDVPPGTYGPHSLAL